MHDPVKQLTILKIYIYISTFKQKQTMSDISNVHSDGKFDRKSINSIPLQSLLLKSDCMNQASVNQYVKTPTSPRFARVIRRSNNQQLLEKRNKQIDSSPKISYIPSPRNMIENINQQNKQITQNHIRNSCLSPRTYENKSTQQQQFKFELNSQSALNVTNVQKPQSQKRYLKNTQEIELLQQIKQLTSLNNYQSSKNKKLTVVNTNLNQQLAQLKQKIEANYLPIKQVNKIKMQYQATIDQHKQINRCLQYIIQGLNQKISELLEEQTFVKYKYQPNQSLESIIKEQISEDDLNNSTYDEKQQIDTRRYWESNITDNGINSLTNINDINWQQQRIQHLQLQNQLLKNKVKQLSKASKYHELEVCMNKKIRDELTLEKSLRQSLQNKNRVLSDKIQKINKVNNNNSNANENSKERKSNLGYCKNCQKKISISHIFGRKEDLEESLTFSFDNQ